MLQNPRLGAITIAEGRFSVLNHEHSSFLLLVAMHLFLLASVTCELVDVKLCR